MGIPEKYYNYLACIGLGVALLFTMNRILQIKDDKITSTVREPFKNAAKDYTKTRSGLTSVKEKLVLVSRNIGDKLDVDEFGIKYGEKEPEGGVYQEILNELEDALELAQLATLLSFSKGEMGDEETKLLGEKLRNYEQIRKSCKESAEFVLSDRS
jgi:hypothetical protein